MRSRSPTELRLELAEGHWMLGEYDDALACLERVEGDADAVRALVERLLAHEDAPAPRARLADLLAQLDTGFTRVLATPTLAALLKEQGHDERALRVAEDVLRRSPSDPRAQALVQSLCVPSGPRADVLATLERWLAYFRNRRQGEVHA